MTGRSQKLALLAVLFTASKHANYAPASADAAMPLATTLPQDETIGDETCNPDEDETTDRGAPAKRDDPMATGMKCECPCFCKLFLLVKNARRLIELVVCVTGTRSQA